jgi:hypothetical protein
MKQAKFTKEDIANLTMRRFLQRALPGGSIQGLKAYIARIGPLPSNRRQQCLQQRNHPPNLPVDPAANAAPAKEIGDLHIDPAATATLPKEVVINAVTDAATVVLLLLPNTARKAKRKKWDSNYYQKKKTKILGLFTSPMSTATPD